MRIFLDASDPGFEQVLALTTKLLVLAAFFQIFDGLQVMASLALRGMKDTIVPLWYAALGYWVLAQTRFDSGPRRPRLPKSGPPVTTPELSAMGLPSDISVLLNNVGRQPRLDVACLIANQPPDPEEGRPAPFASPLSQRAHGDAKMPRRVDLC